MVDHGITMLRFIDDSHAPPSPPPGIKDPDTFTRWRKHYMLNGYFQPDRRGRFTSGFLLRHDDLKEQLRQWILGRIKKDINILDVCDVYTHAHPEN